MPDAFEIALTEKITRMCVAKEGATTYYVDGTSGNDGANGLTWESAKKTIQAAVDIADSWADIYVKAGTYNEDVIISESYISLLGENRATTIIQVPIGGSGVVLGSNNITVSDFAIQATVPDSALQSSWDFQRIQSCDFNRQIVMRGDFCVLDDIYTIHTIWLNGSRNVVSNCFAENSVIGFRIDDQFGASQYNVLVRNEALNCTQGLYNKKYAGGSEHNTIAHNNFVSCATPLEDESANNSYFENYYSNHTNVDNGSGIAVAPYAFVGGSDPRPVIVRNGWLAQALSGVSGATINAKQYEAVSNRTVGSETFAIANTEYNLVNLDGESTNKAYSGRLKVRLAQGHQYIIHKYTQVNAGGMDEVGTGNVVNTAASEVILDGFTFNDTETIRYTVECDSASGQCDYEYAYASRGE